jgi:precorrin-6B methylase 2
MTKPDVSILEIGSGNSTLFWLDRGHPVTSLETNETWYAQINDMSRENYPLADLKFVEYVSPESLTRILGDRKFDVVINDGPGDRVSIHHMLIDYLTPNGFLVWDNSERETSAAAIDELTHQGWRCLHFDGMGPINAYSWRTSVLWKGSFPFVN